MRESIYERACGWRGQWLLELVFAGPNSKLFGGETKDREREREKTSAVAQHLQVLRGLQCAELDNGGRPHSLRESSQPWLAKLRFEDKFGTENEQQFMFVHTLAWRKRCSRASVSVEASSFRTTAMVAKWFAQKRLANLVEGKR